MPAQPTPAPTCAIGAIMMVNFGTGAPLIPPGASLQSFFGSTTLPASSNVFAVDVNMSAPTCSVPWTVSSSDRTAVQLSPAQGQGEAWVEIFVVANSGGARATPITIAGQTVTVSQQGK